ncbi:MAG: CD225/dispanin family protein [Culturomica sp.]|jgi:hypothetical protein|nr:CD225/dispanin family protein [Culturomica sp.]
MVLYCRNCGAEVPENAVVCPRCGASLRNGFNYNGAKPPKTWLVESILATLFCCLPFGIVGIVNAARVETRFYAGDFEGARRASVNAGRWTLVSVLCSVIVVIIYLAIFGFAVFSSLTNLNGMSGIY